MGTQIACPCCSEAYVELEQYVSMMVLSETHALFSLRCSQCGSVVSFIEEIPPTLYDDVYRAAAEVGAGMGQPLKDC